MGALRWIQTMLARAAGAEPVEVFHVRGITTAVANPKQLVPTAAAVERLDEALALIERYQPWRLRHLRRDLNQIRVMRYPCRGAYIPQLHACMVELTFLGRRDIGAATVASTIVHEGMHARVHRMCDPGMPRDRAREERLCRRAEMDFGYALPPDIGAPVIGRARESLALADEDVAPQIDWNEAQRRIHDVDSR